MPPISTRSPTSNGRNNRIRIPLAKLPRESCSAKATTNPAAPITASNGPTLISSVVSATSTPIAMTNRRTDTTMNCSRSCEVFLAFANSFFVPRPASLERKMKTIMVIIKTLIFFSQRRPPSSDVVQPVMVFQVASASVISTCIPDIADMY